MQDISGRLSRSGLPPYFSGWAETRGSSIRLRSSRRDQQGHTTRGTFIVVLLLSTLILAGALAYQGMVSVASHRATADAVIRDYAAFAAERYADRITQQLEYYGIRPVLQDLAVRHVVSGETAVPTTTTLREDANRQLRQSLELVRYFFRFDANSGDLVLSGDADERPPEWLGARLADHVRADGDTTANVHVAFFDDADAHRVVAYVVYRNAASRPTGYGFEAKPDEFEEYFRRALSTDPLLPTSLTRGVSYDSVLTVSIYRADGTEYLTITERPTTTAGYAGSAHHPLPQRLGGLTVGVMLDAAAAGMLVIGGLPYSRLPFILGLFVLTAGLIFAALLQFRRERELDRLRTEFVSNVSHELRTPLAQIRMFAETLLLGRVRSDEEHQRSLSIIDKETRRLTHLVENVLLFSRSERRNVKLEREDTELKPLLEEVVDTFTPLAESKRCSVSLEAGPIVLHADRGAVQQIVLNLLDNAVKYGPPGQHIRIRAELHDDNVRISVEDEGPGIPESDRTKVWERFGRLERERSGSVAGAGIGLAVVRQLTDLHRGHALVETGSRGGARFVVELPGAGNVRQPHESNPAPDDTVAEPVHGSD